MPSYLSFARFYDGLMQDACYEKRCDYILKLAGISIIADSLAAIKYGKVRVIRDGIVVNDSIIASLAREKDQTKEVKQLAVSYDQGKLYVEPSISSAKDKTYPISRPLFYFYNKENTAKVKPIIDFALSPEGQKIVAEIGYIPLN